MGTALVVQWLRLHTPNAGWPGSIPGQGTRLHILQLKIPHAATEGPTHCSEDQRPCMLQLRCSTARKIHIYKKKVRSAATLESSVAFPQKVIMLSSKSSPSNLTKRNENLCSLKTLSMNGHSSIIYRSPEVETIQKFISL